MSQFDSIEVKDGYVTLAKTCSIKEESYSVTVTEADYQTWKAGKLIQNVFPRLSPEDREFLLTGLTPAEQDEVFGVCGEACETCYGPADMGPSEDDHWVGDGR